MFNIVHVMHNKRKYEENQKKKNIYIYITYTPFTDVFKISILAHYIVKYFDLVFSYIKNVNAVFGFNFGRLISL